jgi:hypothetical protein
MLRSSYGFDDQSSALRDELSPLSTYDSAVCISNGICNEISGYASIIAIILIVQNIQVGQLAEDSLAHRMSSTLATPSSTISRTLIQESTARPSHNLNELLVTDASCGILDGNSLAIRQECVAELSDNIQLSFLQRDHTSVVKPSGFFIYSLLRLLRIWLYPQAW